MLESLKTMAIQNTHKKDADLGSPLVSGMPYISVVNDTTLMLRDGDLMSSFSVEGICADTESSNFIQDLSEGFARAIAQQPEKIAYYVHRLSIETKPTAEPVEANDFCKAVDERWQDYIQNVGLRDRRTIITLVARPRKKVSKLLHIFDKDDSYDRQEIFERANILDQAVSAFMSVTKAAKPNRLRISDGQWLSFLKTISDGISAPLVPSNKFMPVADVVANSNVTFKGKSFISEGVNAEDRRHCAIISIKDYPTSTYPGILDNLCGPFDTVVTQSFTPINNLTAQTKISRVAAQMKAAEDAAVSLLAQLQDAEDDVASGREIFGEHHCSVAVFCKSAEELEEALIFITRGIQGAGAALVRESFCARAVYFAQHPGNFNYRTRASMISSHNFAHMTAMHGQPKGHPKERSPWGDAITIVPTASGETFRFNFHLAGAADQRTVGHTLILGQTGAGKTLGTAFMMSQAQRIKPRIIAFDKDNGLEMAIRAMGGAYLNVKMGEKTGFNPFRAESDERGAAWLSDWLTVLIDRSDRQLTAEQLQGLIDAVQANMVADERLQNFEQFRSQLRSTDDDGDLYSRLGRWDEDGQFGWMFGGKEWDPLSFENHITAFDLTEIFDNDIIRTAWLSYVFRRIERLVEDQYPTLIVLDEAWRLLDDPYFEKRLKDWMLTMRKKNVAVVLLTQRVSHIVNSAAGAAILESAVTRLLYPSTYNTEDELAPLNLTPTEMEFMQSSNVDNYLALLKSGTDSLVIDLDLSALGGCLDVLGGGAGTSAPENWREIPEFYEEMI